MSHDPHTYTARYVFTASGSPIPNGIVVVNGDRIESVEAAGSRKADIDFGNAAIIPGLVNPHTHLDLSGARGLIPPTDLEHFTDWLRGVIAYRKTRTAEQVHRDIREGLAECLRFGTTLIGDISSDGGSWDVIAEAKTRAVVFFEMIGTTRQRFGTVGYEGVKLRLIHPDTATCVWGKSPHAPYSVLAAGFRLILGGEGVFAVHVAETAAEVDLILCREGSFVSFLRDLGVWESDALISTYRELANSMGPDGHHLLIHANYLPPDVPFRPNQSIVYCPRTHAAFKHPPHPFREFRQRGVRVCLGTDSLASNPDLDILAEARFVHQRYPDFPGDQLLRMVTLDGAEALGWADEAGSLEAGKSADFVVVPLADDERSHPHELLFADYQGERRTMFRGEMRV